MRRGDGAIHKTIKRRAGGTDKAGPATPKRGRLVETLDNAILSVIKRDDRQAVDRKRHDRSDDFFPLFIMGSMLILVVSIVVAFFVLGL